MEQKWQSLNWFNQLHAARAGLNLSHEVNPSPFFVVKNGKDDRLEAELDQERKV